VLLTLERIDGGSLPGWQPGAHVEFRLPSGLLRQYSLCGDPTDEYSYSVAVLRESGGRGGSVEVHAGVRTGTELSIRPPRNHFPLVGAEETVLIAGGIGITPLKAMAEELEHRGATWRLVYGGRRWESMAFAADLVALGGSRVHLVPENTQGLIDVAGEIEAIGEAAHIYCCGPPGLLDAVTSECSAREAGDRLHVERFTTTEGDPVDAREDTAFEVELRASGATLTVPADQSLLTVVRTIRPDIEFSCREGYCGSCETRVVEGEPEHRGTLMSAEEHDEEGTMLICVGRSRSPRLVLDL
jgi:ferredoxin-NADP reductase